MPVCGIEECYKCDEVSWTDKGAIIKCGCVVKEIHPPDMYNPSFSWNTTSWDFEFISRCEKHSPKVDSRKATPGTEFAFTLTMPPDYEPKKPIEESAKLIMMNGLTADKPYEKAKEWAIVLEHTSSGTPHVHGVYKTESGRRISSKYFARYWPLWDEKVKLGAGHKGGYHNKARHGESYAAYLEKEGVVIKSSD